VRAGARPGAGDGRVRFRRAARDQSLRAPRRAGDAVTDRDRIRVVLPRADFTLDVDLELPHSGITALFGPSGAGKTSVLRCVAGLDRAQPGVVRIAGETWQDEAVTVPAWKRAVG